MIASQVIKAVKAIFTGDSLGEKVRRGSLFILLSNMLNQTLSFARKVILARILVPVDFGLVGMAMIVVSGLQMLSNTGFRPALIQKPDVDKSLLDTAWSSGIIRGGALCCMVFFSAPLMARFFNNESAASILRAMSVLPLMQGFQNIGTVYFDKELKFRQLLVYQQSMSITALVASLLCVLIWRNAWAIVAGSMAGEASAMVTSYLLHPYRPSWQVRWNDFRTLFGFGRSLLIIGVVTYILDQGGNVLIGRLIGPAALGTYLLAYSTAILPMSAFADLVRRVTFPAYARIQGDRARLQHAFLQSFKISMILFVPISIGLFLVSDSFISLVYGPRWQNAVGPLKILCFLALFRANSYIIAPLLHGVGRPNLAAKARVIELIVFGASVYPMTQRYGAVGVALTITATYCIALLLRYYYLLKILPSSLKPMTQIVLKVMLNSLGMIAAILLLRSFIHSMPALFVLVLVSAIVYFSITLMTDKRWFYNLAHQ
ncbi:lipopolysaccharide biosynthesis protein [Candidatus Poribacteria bacterium]